MRRTVSLPIAALIAAAALTSCSSNGKQGASSDTSQLNKPSTAAAATSAVRLAWSHTGTFFDKPQIWYVAQVSNPGKSVASVALDTRALDKTDTIVGSNQTVLPNIPAGATFDYFGYLGGGGALDTELTGTPAKVQVAAAKNAFGQAGAVEQPMLKTGPVALKQGHADTYTDAPYSYNLTVKVTNSTHDTVSGRVTQQVVLYDAKGNVVGGDTGSSDNVPDNLPAGMSYREQWSGIPAMAKAVRAVYTVWQG
ncbi:hypothetical protein OG601_39375 [Streptomyces sp. NBC_01239]|uniref:hypothetical protein n=1 Tax=Streptomyces sp. NBC_01239 TaxID=2903792 RepID=UPI0022513EF8|nr:hypothetical protein [Streptomyces sp. NBC_01239]MCX4816662.1 hypothetical protein [Streptomyces sp. NBC_01239]